ncbi:hypothetical protein HPB48_009228 [Haemaphysalis longicornis]|uniref:DDE Tnp4 domain-containing protein n=1 Tax=Haemaphysalis longicornis TaxID=44386 RepID=A0A9J6GJU3_HAELO|nr:hypothetical protein HPB48_009228 [Haemaphysalis longicornis]
MADKGFRIDYLVDEIRPKLNIPPFLRRELFTAEGTQETQGITAHRIHVERRIQCIRWYHTLALRSLNLHVLQMKQPIQTQMLPHAPRTIHHLLVEACLNAAPPKLL